MHPQEWCEVQLRGDARQELAIYDRAEASVLVVAELRFLGHAELASEITFALRALCHAA